MYLLQCWELNVVFVCLFVFCLPGKYLPLSYNPRPLFTFIIDIFFMCVCVCEIVSAFGSWRRTSPPLELELQSMVLEPELQSSGSAASTDH